MENTLNDILDTDFHVNKEGGVNILPNSRLLLTKEEHVKLVSELELLQAEITVPTFIELLFFRIIHK